MSTTQLDPSGAKPADAGVRGLAPTGRRRRSSPAALEAAWNAGDGQGFGGALCRGRDVREDRGEHHRGRDAIARGHAGIFGTIYADSTNRMEVVDARHVADDVIVARRATPWTRRRGPLAGIHAALRPRSWSAGRDLAGHRHPQHDGGRAMSALVGGTVGEARRGPRGRDQHALDPSEATSAPARSRGARRRLRRRRSPPRTRRRDAPARDERLDARQPPRARRLARLAARTRGAPRGDARHPGRPGPAAAATTPSRPGSVPGSRGRSSPGRSRRRSSCRTCSPGRRARRVRGGGATPMVDTHLALSTFTNPLVGVSAALLAVAVARAAARGPPGSRRPRSRRGARFRRRRTTAGGHGQSAGLEPLRRADPHRRLDHRHERPRRPVREGGAALTPTRRPRYAVAPGRDGTRLGRGRGTHPSGCPRKPSWRLAHWSLQYDTM